MFLSVSSFIVSLRIKKTNIIYSVISVCSLANNLGMEIAAC